MHPRRRAVVAFANILLGNPQDDEENPVYPIEEVAGRVFTNRPTPLWETELPDDGGAVCLYAVSETSENNSEPKYYVRTLRLIAEIVVQSTENSDEIIETIAEKIENLILHNKFLKDPAFDYGPTPYTGIPEDDPANTADDIELTDTEFVFVGEKVENIVVSCRLAFDVIYSSTPNYGVPDGEFDKLHTTYNPDGADEQSPANTTLRVNIHQD